MHRLNILLIGLLCVLLAGCAPIHEESSAAEVTSAPAESSEEESLPEKEALALLYDYYITAEGGSDGFTYRYTYCIDEEGKVFNAEACITFPDTDSAEAEYKKLLLAGYPNLVLQENALSFAFPRRDCPYFGVSYTALPYLLEETPYTVVDSVLPAEGEITDDGFDFFD
ncbi:MAG: hypothetical protein IJD82_03665 [Clostridia bacterium]|nr:hypothetical protein [Clostridia bacterium]